MASVSSTGRAKSHERPRDSQPKAKSTRPVTKSQAMTTRNAPSNSCRNVFINLYEIAQTRREKSQDNSRLAKQEQIKKSQNECTFKPDFSMTQRVTNKYLKKKHRHEQQLKEVYEQGERIQMKVLDNDQKLDSLLRPEVNPSYRSKMAKKKQSLLQFVNHLDKSNISMYSQTSKRSKNSGRSQVSYSSNNYKKKSLSGLNRMELNASQPIQTETFKHAYFEKDNSGKICGTNTPLRDSNKDSFHNDTSRDRSKANESTQRNIVLSNFLTTKLEESESDQNVVNQNHSTNKHSLADIVTGFDKAKVPNELSKNLFKDQNVLMEVTNSLVINEITAPIFPEDLPDHQFQQTYLSENSNNVTAVIDCSTHI